MRRGLLRAPWILLLIGLALAAGPARAAWPERPIKVILPFPPGGAADQTIRLFAEHLTRDLGVAIVVESRPGANTIIGAEAASRAEPDGHTLLMASGSSILLNPMLYKRLPYDPARDLRPLAIATEAPMLVVVHPSVPARTMGELVALAKAQPDRLAFGSSGAGNSTHLAVELFLRTAGIRMTHVPYKGSGPALNDLVAGQIQVMFDVMTSALPHAQAGSLRALAVTTGTRLSLLPDVPTVAESGFPDYQASAWYGFFAPSRVPEPVVARLTAAIAKAQADPALRAALEKLGFVAMPPLDPAALAAYLEADRARWASVVKALDIALE